MVQQMLFVVKFRIVEQWRRFTFHRTIYVASYIPRDVSQVDPSAPGVRQDWPSGRRWPGASAGSSSWLTFGVWQPVDAAVWIVRASTLVDEIWHALDDSKVNSVVWLDQRWLSNRPR